MKLKRRNLYLIIGIVLLVSISLGTALLNKMLEIAGNTTIKKNSWVIYFDGVRKSTDSVESDKDATITDQQKTKIEFSANLQNPGDFYEFTVYTVNDGSIDAMVDSVEKKALTDEQKKYLDFIVTYDNGKEIKKCDLLRANTRRRVKAIVKFKDNLELEDYPKEDVNLDLYFIIHYVQQKDTCVPDPEGNQKVLTINPNGGTYNKRKDETRIYLEKDETYTIEEPTRFNYNFKGWEIVTPQEEESRTFTLEEDTFTMGEENVEIRAIWEEGDFVARIMNTYYKTLDEAFLAADEEWEDNTVYMIRNTKENPTNSATKAFVFNLGGYTLTGSITNPTTGNIRLVNGKVKADENHEEAILNYGVVTLGTQGNGVQTENSITLVSSNVGIRNVKTNGAIGNFYFYDGYIEAKVGLVGGYTSCENNYFVFSEHVTERNTQRIYLIKNSNRAIAKTETEGAIYYYNLQDAINSVETNKRMEPSFTDNDYIIYAFREFEAAYELNVSEGSRVIFDFCGHDISTGAQITNNGYFKLTNSQEVNSRYKPSVEIINNGSLDINNLYVIASADKNIIENEGQLILTKTTLQGKKAYALNNKGNGTLVIDQTSALKATENYGLHNTSSNFTVNNGIIYGIHNEGTINLTENVEVHNGDTSYAVNNSGTFNMNGGEISDTKNDILISNTSTFNVNGGRISSQKTSIKGGKIIVNDGEITSKEGPALNSLDITINGGEITSESGKTVMSEPYVTYSGSRYIQYPGYVTVNGGTITSNDHGVYTSIFTMTGGTIVSENIGVEDFKYKYPNNTSVVINSKSTISGGTINATNNALISNDLTMTGGTITSTEDTATVLKEKGTITGGTVIGDKYGVYSNGTLTLGTDDETISQESPVLQGKFFGLYIEGSETNFYDGILKGTTNAYYGNITGTPTGSVILEGEETINEELYNTKYISQYKNWLKVGNEEFESIDEASKAIESEGTITLIDDADVTFIQHFLDENKNKHITFDLNGHTITTTQPIYNETTVEIIDSSNEKTGKIIATRVNGIINEINHELTITSGTYQATSNNKVIENRGTLTITSANVQANTTAIVNYNSLTIEDINIHDTQIGISNTSGTFSNKRVSGLLTINNGTINTADIAISMENNNNSHKVIINAGTIHGDNYAVKGNYGVLQVNGGTISATNESAIYTYYDNLTINGGEITSENKYGIESASNITINNGTIQGKIGVKNIYYTDRNIVVNNGHIIGTENEGMNITGNSSNNYVKLYIYGGVVEGATDGIHTTARTQVGQDDIVINIESPSIIGHTEYGIVTDYYLAFYDGTLKGITDGYHGLVSIIPDGALLKDDYEYINKIEYQTDYIITKGNWLKVGDEEFNSINKAAKKITEEGEMIVIADAYVDFAQTIPTGKKITLDLNGHSLIMTQPITTKGELTLINSKENGGINNLRDHVIINQGKTTLMSGYLHSDTSSVINNQSTFIMNGGEVVAATGYGITNSSNLTVNGGKITAENNNAIYTTNTTTITGGEITSQKGYGIYEYNGTLNVKGGTITSENSDGVYLYGYSSTAKFYMENGEIIGNKYGINAASYQNYNNKVEISGGTVRGLTESGVITSHTTTVTGGTLEGAKYGLYVNDSTSYNKTTTIGTDDGVINIDAPILKGDLYGLYISYGTVNFYDGVIKGITGRHSGIITSIARHAQIFEDEEVIDRKNYLTEYLVTETEIAENVQTGETYGNLQEALDEALSNQTIRLLSNVPVYYELTINKNPNITLDLNGKTISTNKKIVNSVPFTITNSTEEEATIKISTAINLITNNSELLISNVTIKNNSSSNYVITNTNKLTVDNVKIDSLNGIQTSNEASIINSNITSSRIAINNTGKLNISGGTYTCTTNSSNYYSLYSSSTQNVVVNNATLNGIDYNGGNNTAEYNNVTVNGTLQNAISNLTINSSNINNGRISNTGVLTLNDSTYQATLGSTSSTSPDVAIQTSKTLTLNHSNVLINTTDPGKYTTVISNSKTLNILNESNINIGMSNNTSYDYKAIVTTSDGITTIDNSNITVLGGATSYGVYLNSEAAKVIILTGRIDVERAVNAYGAYADKGTFEMGHFEGTGYENAEVSTTNPLIYVQGSSRGIGVKKTNGAFNFYDGIIRASKYAKPETTTNVEYQFEATTYVDENTGFEYALLEWMQNDYQGDTVALLNGVYYKTVQEAIDKAEANDQITLLKSISEDLTVPATKNVKINLNKHSITTSIINSGRLNVFNGSLQSFDEITVINFGTFIMGEDDSKVSNTNIRIISETTTIDNKGTLIIYDGYIEGQKALEGKVNEVAPYARIRTEKDINVEKKYIQSLSQEAILSGETDLIITIDPASGYYNNSKEEQEIYLKHGESYKLETPVKSGCDFLGWEISDPTTYDEGYITVDLQDVSVKAKWKISDNAVAKIGEDYFITLQDALDFAQDGNTVELFKNVTENVTNRKNIVLNLGGKTVTGEFINQGELKLLDGEINNPNGTGIINNKTLTLGENDGEIKEEYIRIIGTDIGLEQNGKFNFYDGFIEGDVALSGKIDNVPKGYFLYNDHNIIKDCQRVYLIGNPENAVAVIENGGTQYFFNLQDAIDTATLTGSEIYIARNFEGTYPITVANNAVITINMMGNDITLGNTVTNNGTLTIHDSSEDKLGSISLAKTITNTGTLTIDKVNINENNTSNATITNTGVLNISNATITSKNGYTINTSGDGDLQIGENTTLTATGNYAIYNNQTKALEINSGTISGINNLKELILGGNVEVIVTGRYAVNMSTSNSKLTMNNGKLQANTHVIYMYGSNVQVTINGGNIKGTGSTYVIYDGYNTSTESYRSYLTINGGLIESNYYGIYLYMNTFTMNGGEIKATYPNSNQYSYYALYCGSYTYCTINEGSKITGENVSAIYKESSSKDMKITGAEITTLTTNGYGVMMNGGNLTITDTTINAPRTSAYGIYMNSTSTAKNVTLNNTNINSGNVGIYVNNNGSTYNTNLNINSGNIYGDTYGIQQVHEYTKVNIGNSESDSVENPYVKGKLYGLYKTAGITNFYSGKLGGSTYGYNNEIDSVTAKKEITDNSEQDSIAAKANTHTTTSFSQTATPQQAKAGNGYARITYIGESNGMCENGQSIDFNYNEREQAYLVPCSGKYALEVWGAQGGSHNNSYQGGYGGYSKGEIILTENQMLYINVGGAGVKSTSANTVTVGGYNGGGDAVSKSSSYYVCSGGGATHIATQSGLLSTLENNKDKILIVAGGGGGAQYYNNSNRGGSGGGYQGANSSTSSSSYYTTGGTQTSGGYYSYNYQLGRGSFGQGGTIVTENITYFGSGGGGGYYGGAASSHQYCAGSGGSGYVGNELLTNTEMYGYNVPIPTVDFVINYLIDKDTFLKVGDNAYSSFEDAIDYIDDNLDGVGTIELIKDATVQTPVTIPSTNNIIFDLAGHNLTMTTSITNTGTFEVIDSTEGKTGKITNKTTNNIINQGTLTITNGEIVSTKNTPIVGKEVSGTINICEGVKLTGKNGIYLHINQTVNINKATLTGSVQAIYSQGYGSTINVTDSTLAGTTYGMYLNSYGMNITLTNTTTTASNGSGIYDAYTTNSTKNNITINGGSVEGTTYGIYLNYTNLTTENTTIKTTSSSVSYYALNMNAYGPTVTLNQGTHILSPSTSAVRLNTSLTMNAGEIKAEGTDSNGISFYDSPGGSISLNIYSGTIYGKKNGIHQKHTNITTTLGNKDEELSITDPLIEGVEYGIYKEAGKTNFYSGRLKGKKNSYYGEFSKTRKNKTIYTLEEIIDEEHPKDTYKVSYLVETEGFLEVNGTTYNNFKDAIDAIEGTGTIKVLNDNLTHEEVTIPEGKNVTIDLNNHKITMSQTIINNQKLVIKDDSEEKKGTINNVNENTIQNNGTLTVSNTKLQSTKTVIYGNSGTGTVTINNNATITGDIGIYLNVNQTLNIDDASITGTTKGINLQANNTVFTMNESKVNGGTYGIYTYGQSNILTIIDSTITSAAGSGIYDERSKNVSTVTEITVTGGTINASTYGVYANYDNVTITGTTINNNSTSKTNYGVYCNSGSTCNLNEETIINAPSSSGLYVYSTTNLKGVEINSNGTETYGIYVNGGTLTLSDNTEINANGGLSYGIYAEQYQTTININGANIYSKNIGVYLGKARTDAKTLNVNSGSIIGETYGIHQTVANGTTKIGNLDNNNSIDNPYIEGGLISINKEAGLLYFYSGRLKGYLKGNPGTVDYVRDGYEIFEDSDEIQLYLKNNRTISTTEASETATENTAKIGNGAAKITYVEHESDTLNQPTIVDEVKSSSMTANTDGDPIEVYNFEYTGDVQEFDIPQSGVYKLEVWGAEGGKGHDSASGLSSLAGKPGKGGYSQGTIVFSNMDTLYVYVGGKGENVTIDNGGTAGFNGGGSGAKGSGSRSGGGGGASDIRINEDSLYSRVIVAGGGGGTGWNTSLVGGSGGGTNGTDGNGVSATGGKGGTQTSGGLGEKNGEFGLGANSPNSTGFNPGPPGGGGWYGGGSGYSTSSGNNAAGGGGSGYIYTDETSIYYPDGCLLDDRYYLADANTINGTENFNSPSGETEKGHSGNGYIRISYYGGDDTQSDTYTVKLKSDYGTIANSELTYSVGDTLGNIPQPTLENNNMTFVGWFTNKSYTKMVTENTIVNANFTLYAKFIYSDEYCDSLINSASSFDYTGEQQTFTALCPGKYKLEVWGAQGGSSTYGSNSNTGGYGGYSSGIININREEKIYITVGGKGGSASYNGSSITYDGSKGYNGGGYGTYYGGNSAQGGGGGATHIATTQGLLKSLSSDKKSVLIVAGGGGGAITSSTGTTFSGDGGPGGGLVGGSAVLTNDSCYNYGTGGTQYATGTYKVCPINGNTNRNNNPTNSPSFGLGANYTSNSNSRYYAGGGAGWYGGQSGYRAPGGGGSGYVGNSKLANTIMYGYNIETYYDADVTNIAYLVENTDFVENTTTHRTYLNLQIALDEADENDTLQLIADSNISYDVIVTDGTKVIIDFNGHNIATSKKITNNGNLTLINSDTENTSTITNNISMTLFENNGVLNVNNVNIKAYVAINNTITGRLDINNSNINATSQGIINENIMTIESSTIHGTTYGVYSDSAKPDTITNSTITSTSTAFYKYNLGKTTITNTNITGQLNNNKTGAVLEITGGTLNGLVNNVGNTTIKNATIDYLSNTNNTEYQIKNTGLMTLQEDLIKYKNTTYNTNNYQQNNIYNTGTLTSNSNTYKIEYNYSNTNNYNSYRYKTLYNLQNQGILTSTNDSFEAYGGTSAYAVYNASNNTNTVTNPTINLHHNNSSYGFRNASGKLRMVNGTIDISNSSTGYGIYTDAGTPTIAGTTVTVHDNSSTSYGAYIQSGTLTIESGSVNVSGGTVYGVYNNSNTATIVLGIEDGCGTDAADVSITNPHIEAIGTTTGIGVRMGDGSFNYFDGYITGSTSPRGAGDITSKTDKNYQVVTRHDDETGYDYCILEFIK